MFYVYRNMHELLKGVYPEYPWDPILFDSVKAPSGYWQDNTNLLKVLSRAEKGIGLIAVSLNINMLKKLIRK